MASVERLLEMTGTVAAVANDKINRINGITRRSRMLALNATIEAHRFGAEGRGFAVVADEVKAISAEIADLTSALQGELRGKLDHLSRAGQDMARELSRIRGERLADLAHNAVEIADRNLYERSCDVRWWATDPAVVDCASQAGDPALAATAIKRLGVILDSYTVYLDLWVADTQGRIIATGRPGRYGAMGADVSQQQWFRDALATRDGGDFAVADIATNALLDGAQVATYATAIRAGGDKDGPIVGALGVFFDWEAQAQAIVDGVRLTPEERGKSTCLLLDRHHRIIAASNRQGVLIERFPLDTAQGPRGFYRAADGQMVAYALTPGYETYQGLGWYGVIVQED